MRKTCLPLVMLLVLAALLLLSGCAGTAPTPTQAMREAEGQVPAQPVELTATPTLTPTPEPTETPTPTPTPTPEATPTPDAEAIVRRIQEKLSQEQQVYRNDMWVKLRGSSAYKDILVWGNLKLTEALGINYDLAQLVKQGHDVRIVWVGKNWEYSKEGYSYALEKAAFCLFPDTKYASKRSRFVASEITPLNGAATFFLSDRGVAPTRRYELAWNIFGTRGRSAYDGQVVDIQAEHDLIVLVDGEVKGAVHLRTVQDNDPNEFRDPEGRGRFNIFVTPYENSIPAEFEAYVAQCANQPVP